MSSFPKQVAVALCKQCGEVSFARHVNQEDQIPPRYCVFDSTPLEVGIYAFEREVAEPKEPKKKRHLPTAPPEGAGARDYDPVHGRTEPDGVEYG